MRLVEKLRAWRAADARRREYAALSASEREAIARDVGVCEERLAAAVESGRTGAPELKRMLGVIGVDAPRVGALDRRLVRELEATCAGCQAVRTCRRHLDSGTARAVYAAFCPNAPALRGLTEDARRRA